MKYCSVIKSNPLIIAASFITTTVQHYTQFLVLYLPISALLYEFFAFSLNGPLNLNIMSNSIENLYVDNFDTITLMIGFIPKL